LKCWLEKGKVKMENLSRFLVIALVLAAACSPSPGTGDETNPLYFFYVIHVHIVDGDNAPYTDNSLSQLNSVQAENMLAAIEGIAAVLDQHGAKGTWEGIWDIKRIVRVRGT
jgi:hypothetical protein